MPRAGIDLRVNAASAFVLCAAAFAWLAGETSLIESSAKDDVEGAEVSEAMERELDVGEGGSEDTGEEEALPGPVGS